MPNQPESSLNLPRRPSAVRKPAFCCIGVSRKCCLRCKMCEIWKSQEDNVQNEPTLKQWQRFIDQLAKLTGNSAVVNFAGGEPLLDERNLALINYSAQKGMFTSMPSNGFLINKPLAQRIAESGLSEIEISLDGVSKHTHDFLRGVEGCYEKAWQAIDYLDSCGGKLKIAVIAIIMENNLDEIVRLAQLVNQDKRIKAIIFQAVAQPFNTPWDDQWYKKSAYGFLWPRDLKKVFAVIDELIRLKQAGYKLANPVSQLEVFKKYFSDPSNFIKKVSCNIDFYMNISQFGQVYICPHKEALGNLKDNTLEEIWFSLPAARIREEIKQCSVNCHHLLNCCYEE